MNSRPNNQPLLNFIASTLLILRSDSLPTPAQNQEAPLFVILQSHQNQRKSRPHHHQDLHPKALHSFLPLQPLILIRQIVSTLKREEVRGYPNDIRSSFENKSCSKTNTRDSKSSRTRGSRRLGVKGIWVGRIASQSRFRIMSIQNPRTAEAGVWLIWQWRWPMKQTSSEGRFLLNETLLREMANTFYTYTSMTFTRISETIKILIQMETKLRFLSSQPFNKIKFMPTCLEILCDSWDIYEVTPV